MFTDNDILLPKINNDNATDVFFYEYLDRFGMRVMVCRTVAFTNEKEKPNKENVEDIIFIGNSTKCEICPIINVYTGNQLTVDFKIDAEMKEYIMTHKGSLQVIEQPKPTKSNYKTKYTLFLRLQ